MARRLLTLDSNVLIAALKADEPHSEHCAEIVSKATYKFLLTEPSVIYAEVCGTLARRVGVNVAEAVKTELDRLIHPRLLVNCDKEFCASVYMLCEEYRIYAIDALYLKVALESGATFVSLDREDLIDRTMTGKHPVEAYHVADFPY